MLSRLAHRAALAGALVACSGGDAGATGLSRTDKLRILYSNQFAFDRRGIPIITIGVVGGALEVTVESEAPVRVLPDGEDGSEVVSGKRWRIRMERARPATVEHFAVLAREPAAALAKLQAELARWKQRQARCRLLETGTLFGVKGKVFDNRAYVLADGPYATEAAARAAAEQHQRSYGLPRVEVLAQLKRRPSALLFAAALDSTAELRAHDAIWFAPHDQRQPLRIREGRGPARPYWGQLYVTVGRDGKLAATNAVAADRLLAGLVPAEIFPNAPMAALQAQAVAARGELLAKIGSRHLDDPYLICATQHCQVYRGAGSEHPRTTKAIDATRGLVLVKPDGSLVDAVYSASCGGHTEHNDNVWPTKPDPHLRGHLDGGDAALAPFRVGVDERSVQRWLTARPPTWCAKSTYNRDKYRWTVSTPAQRLDQHLRHLGVGPVKAIKVLSRGVSGRARELEVVGALKTAKITGELNIRRALGGLRSSMFVVRQSPDASGRAVFTFVGGGWGHGVGMCQTGATGMAQGGRSFREILMHYYLGSQVQPLY